MAFGRDSSYKITVNAHFYFKIHAKRRQKAPGAAPDLPALFPYVFLQDPFIEEGVRCQPRDDIPGTWSKQQEIRGPEPQRGVRGKQ